MDGWINGWIGRRTDESSGNREPYSSWRTLKLQEERQMNETDDGVKLKLIVRLQD